MIFWAISFFKLGHNFYRCAQTIKHIKINPHIEHLESKHFVGPSIQISSPLGNEISSKIPGISYGLALSTNQSMEDDTLTYLAAVEVPNAPVEIPVLMLTVNLPAQDYAVFEVSGFHESCHVTADYIKT